MAEGEIRIKALEEVTELTDNHYFIVDDSGNNGESKKYQSTKVLDAIENVAEEIEEKIEPQIETALANGTASGTIAQFTDGSDLPMPSCAIEINAIQSGSGEPSPTNIRPISGFDGANVSVCGKNLFDKAKATDDYYINSQGNESFAYGMRHSGYIKIKSNTAYYTNADATGRFYTIAVYDNNKQFLRTLPIASPSVFNTEEASYIIVNTYNNYTSIDDMYVVEGTTATTYEPYNGHTYSISFGNTVYGGSLDVVSGTLVVDKAMVDLTEGMNGGIISGSYVFYKELGDAKTVPNSQKANIISEDYSTIRYNGVAGTPYTVAIRDNNYIYVNTSDESILPVGKAIYELATPQTYQLSPTAVKSILGNNNVWADTNGVTSVEYVRDATTIINSLLARIEALENA